MKYQPAFPVLRKCGILNLPPQRKRGRKGSFIRRDDTDTVGEEGGVCSRDDRRGCVVNNYAFAACVVAGLEVCEDFGRAKDRFGRGSEGG